MVEASVASSNSVRGVCDYDLLFDCVHCGLCAEACPTYIVTRCEMDSPRGRIYLMKSLAEGHIELDDERRAISICASDAAVARPPARPAFIMAACLKARVYSSSKIIAAVSSIDSSGAPSARFSVPPRLRALLAPLKLVDRLGLRPALRAVMPPMTHDWLDLLPPLEPDLRLLARGANIAPRTGSTDSRRASWMRRASTCEFGKPEQ